MSLKYLSAPAVLFSPRLQVTQLRQKWSSLWLRRLAASAKQSRGHEEQDDAVIASLAAILQHQDQALGLSQPPGIGQRPKQLSVDLTTGQPVTQGHSCLGCSLVDLRLKS